MLLAATIAVVLAAVIDYFGIFPQWLGDRIAALLAIFGLSVFITGTGLADFLLDLGERISAWLGDLVGSLLGSELGAAIEAYGLGVFVFIVAIVWFFALLPNSSARWIGPVATRSMSRGLIWGGAAFMVIGAGLAPGVLGEIARGITTLGIAGGEALVEVVV